MLMHTKEPQMAANAQQFLAGVLLNNKGVDLLEKHCYQQALETFSDAVAVMKEVERSHSSNCFVDTASKLQKATERLANPEVTMFPNCENSAVVQVYSNVGDLSQISLPNLFPKPGANTYLSPLRIDHMEVDDHVSRNALKVTALVLVRNCSLAYQCIAARGAGSFDKAWQDRWYEYALKGLTSVQSGLRCLAVEHESQREKQQRQYDEGVSSCTAYNSSYVAVLAALVLNDLCLVSLALGDRVRAFHCHIELSLLLQQEGGIIQTSMDWRNAAAA